MDTETRQQLVNTVNVNTTEWQTRLIKILDGYTKKEEQAINLSIGRIVVLFQMAEALSENHEEQIQIEVYGIISAVLMEYSKMDHKRSGRKTNIFSPLSFLLTRIVSLPIFRMLTVLLY